MQDVYVEKLRMIVGTSIVFADNCIKKCQKEGNIEGKGEEHFAYIKNTLQELKDKI
jgi:hypothetical protein